MKKFLIYVLLTGSLIFPAQLIPAQQDAAGVRVKKDALLEQRTVNDKWRWDFEVRRQRALNNYREQGLSEDEIYRRMAPFREEARQHRIKEDNNGYSRNNRRENGLKKLRGLQEGENRYNDADVTAYDHHHEGFAGGY